jgi:lipoprotein-releasing system permease protein
VLGVNAHVLVLKYSIDFREYRDVMKKIEGVKGVIGVEPFVINPMMVTHGDRTATGVLLKGVDPQLMGTVLDLPKHIVLPVPKPGVLPDVSALRKPGAKPPERPFDEFRSLDHDDDSMSDNPQKSDAGTSHLLDVIARQIAESDARADGGADSKVPIAADLPPPSPPPPPIDKHKPHAPEGDVTPAGGFASKLPDDDFLPPSLDPDPCKSPDQIAKLPGVIIGRTLGTRLAVGIGDCVQITSPTIGFSIGSSGSRPPIAKQFRVIAIFDAGFDQYDSRLVYTDLYEAQAFYEQGDSVTGIEMKIDDIDHSQQIAKEIDGLLNNGIYHTMDWKELNHGLFTALLIQQIAMSVVLALIIVVAAFTVIATLIMVVLDKKKEIAVLKALGAKNDAILRVFLYQGGFIGMIGTTLGLILGYVCCKGLLAYGLKLDPGVYFISSLPVNVRPTEFLITGGFAILVCLIATIFPAMYAALLRPADGLRAE